MFFVILLSTVAMTRANAYVYPHSAMRCTRQRRTKMAELLEKTQMMEADNSPGKANRTDKESNSASGWEQLVEKVQLWRPFLHWHTPLKPSTVQRQSTGATAPTG